MPVIKTRTRGKQFVQHITRLDRENNETLYAYAQFLGEPTEYVLNQLVESVLAKDKDSSRGARSIPSRMSAPVHHAKKLKRSAISAPRASQMLSAHNRASAPVAG
jgi:hypothetical protein